MKTAYLIFLVIFLNGCLGLEDEYSDLSPENSFSLKLNDMLVYVSNKSEIDSFVVTSFERDYMVHDKKYHYQFEEAYFNLINDTSVNYFVVNHTVNSFKISWFNLYTIIYYSQKPNVITYELNDKIIEDVYIVFNNRPGIKDIYFSNKFGIIRYDINDYEYFELQLTNE